MRRDCVFAENPPSGVGDPDEQPDGTPLGPMCGDCYRLASFDLSGFTVYTLLRGFENSMQDFLLEPEGFAALMDRIIVFELSAGRSRIVAPIVRDLELQGTPDKPAQVVSIGGRVEAPGRYPLEPAMRVSDLIRAGGDRLSHAGPDGM